MFIFNFENCDSGREKTMNDKNRILDKHYKPLMDAGKNFDGQKDYVVIANSKEFDIIEKITVEALIQTNIYSAEKLQSIVSKWSPLTTFNSFDAYEAGSTSGLDSKGFLGAVFDGRYVYFVPQANTTEQSTGQHRHGIVLRYDTHGEFRSNNCWKAYNADNTEGMVTRGYYGAVFDGRYVYFVPRFDGADYHTKVLRYDTLGNFTEKRSWNAYDVGLPISYQGAGFDGRYIYFAPGSDKKKGASGLVLRYDTQACFDTETSWVTFDADNTSGLKTRDFDGVVFDGKYIYFVPLTSANVLRYDTAKEFRNKDSWSAFNATSLNMKRCVGAVFDGQYIYFVAYKHHIIIRYDTRNNFKKISSWSSYDVKKTSGLTKYGYDGGFFDGRYVYFVPFIGEGKEGVYFHTEVLRFNTQGSFNSPESWKVFDASNTSGLKTIGYNAGAFDGRYFYFAPWNRGEGKGSNVVGHGTALRYDTLGNNGSFSLRYCDYGHNGGLCGALPGPRFIVNTDKGVRSISANRKLEPGLHYIVGVYDGCRIQLFLDGKLVNEQSATGRILNSKQDIIIGRIQDGLGYFNGRIIKVGISDCARDAEWIASKWKFLRNEINTQY